MEYAGRTVQNKSEGKKKMKPSTIIKNFRKECQYKGHYFNSLDISKVCFNGAIDRAINPELFPKEFNHKSYLEYSKIYDRLMDIYRKNKMKIHPSVILHNLAEWNDDLEFEYGQKNAYEYLKRIGL